MSGDNAWGQLLQASSYVTWDIAPALSLSLSQVAQICPIEILQSFIIKVWGEFHPVWLWELPASCRLLYVNSRSQTLTTMVCVTAQQNCYNAAFNCPLTMCTKCYEMKRFHVKLILAVCSDSCWLRVLFQVILGLAVYGQQDVWGKRSEWLMIYH